jgi:WD40 repeat protein
LSTNFYHFLQQFLVIHHGDTSCGPKKKVQIFGAATLKPVVHSGASRVRKECNIGIFVADSTDSYELAGTLGPHAENIMCLTFSTHNHLASGSCDHYAKIWDLNTYSLSIALLHDENVMSVNFHSRNDKLATLGEGGTVTVWDLRTQRKIIRFNTMNDSETRCPAAQFCLGGNRLVCHGCMLDEGSHIPLVDDMVMIGIFNAKNGRMCGKVGEVVEEIDTLALYENGNKAATSSLDEDCVRFWDLRSATQEFAIPIKYGANSLCFDGEGSKLLAVSRSGMVLLDTISCSRLLQVDFLEDKSDDGNDVSDGDTKDNDSAPEGSHHPDGTYDDADGGDGEDEDDDESDESSLSVDVVGKAVATDYGKVWSVSMNSDGTRAAVGFENENDQSKSLVRIFDATTGRVIKTMNDLDGLNVCYSPPAIVLL